MIVGSINEDRKIESRIAITPDNVKIYWTRFKSINRENYARHFGIDDNEYMSRKKYLRIKKNFK